MGRRKKNQGNEFLDDSQEPNTAESVKPNPDKDFLPGNEDEVEEEPEGEEVEEEPEEGEEGEEEANEPDLKADYIEQYMRTHPGASPENAEAAWTRTKGEYEDDEDEDEDEDEPPAYIASELIEEANKIRKACEKVVKRALMLERLSDDGDIPNAVVFNIIDDIMMSQFVKEVCEIYKCTPTEIMETVQMVSIGKAQAAAESMEDEMDGQIPRKGKKPTDLDFDGFTYDG